MNFSNQNQESLEEFIQLASQDPQLQQKLKAACDQATTDSEAALRSIVEIGKEFGYSFTSKEVAERLDNTATPSDPSMELSDWELEAVVGGGKANQAATQVLCGNTESCKDTNKWICTQPSFCTSGAYCGHRRSHGIDFK